MQHTPELSSARWRRSSYSNANGGDCVEITNDLPGVVPAAAWDEFVNSLKM